MYSLRGNTPSDETFTHMNREFNHYVNKNCFASQSETNNAPSYKTCYKDSHETVAAYRTK